MKAITSKALLSDLRELIVEAREDVARTVNTALVLLYWRIGKRIRQDILKERRAQYGEQIIVTVSTELTREFGRGFSEKSLRRMMQFAEVFRDESIVASLMRQLTGTYCSHPRIHRRCQYETRCACVCEVVGPGGAGEGP